METSETVVMESSGEEESSGDMTNLFADSSMASYIKYQADYIASDYTSYLIVAECNEYGGKYDMRKSITLQL